MIWAPDGGIGAIGRRLEEIFKWEERDQEAVHFPTINEGFT